MAPRAPASLPPKALGLDVEMSDHKRFVIVVTWKTSIQAITGVSTCPAVDVAQVLPGVVSHRRCVARWRRGSHKGLCGSATNSGLTSEDIPPLFDAPADAPAPGATSTYYIQLPRKPVGSSRSHSCRGRGHSQLSDSMERRYRARRQRYPRQGEEVANGIPVNVCGAGAEHTAQRTAQLLP